MSGILGIYTKGSKNVHREKRFELYEIAPHNHGPLVKAYKSKIKLNSNIFVEKYI